MYELVYTSVASSHLTYYQLVEIIEQARIKNHHLNITGILIYDNREVVQLLEGEKSKVKALYDTIKADTRHESVEVVYENPIRSRTFSNWSMAFRTLNVLEKKSVIADFGTLSPASSTRTIVQTYPEAGIDMFSSLSQQLYKESAVHTS